MRLLGDSVQFLAVGRFLQCSGLEMCQAGRLAKLGVYEARIFQGTDRSGEPNTAGAHTKSQFARVTETTTALTAVCI